MTPQEFKDWYRDLCAAFPAFIADYVERSGDPDATMRHWRDALADCEFADAQVATRTLVREGVQAYERHAIPHKVRSLCARLADERRPAARTAEVKSVIPTERPTDWKLGGVLAKLIDAAAAGRDVHALAEKLMPIDPDDEPRYRCLICKDNGLVTVWHPHAMKAARLGKLTRHRHCARCVVRCSCAAGDHYEGLSRGGYDPRAKRFGFDDPIIFNKREWLPCQGYGERDVEGLYEFMRNYKPANYEDAFDAFNAS